MRPRFLLLAAPLFLPLAASAQPLIQSQEGIALQNEILQLQQQLQQMQAQGGGNGGSALGGGNAPPPSGNAGNSANGGLVASLLTQVQTLQSQVQSLNGQVSELKHEMDTQNAQTQKDIGDLKFQLQNGGAAGQGGQPGQAPGAPASAPSAPPPQAAAPSDPKAALQAALDAYGKHDYAASARLAQGIVAKDKSAPQAYRAQYLVAQSYAAKGDPQNAAIAYDSTYNMNRNGTYAPHALLGLASSLAAINQNGAACDTLSSLNSQFTNQSAGMRADVAAVAKRAHCS
ncbi:tol-pal system YbgF family protein [Acidocella facilis]|uniref:hypothetical protein n=1 Tax=Acidocella facilis TaxID=525 RepID=UPI00047AB9EA|nr:hypothetical protein [Acidocella facilis]